MEKTILYRLTLDNNTWLEREYPEGTTPEDACIDMVYSLPQTNPGTAPVRFSQPLCPGSEDAYDYNDILERCFGPGMWMHIPDDLGHQTEEDINRAAELCRKSIKGMSFCGLCNYIVAHDKNMMKTYPYHAKAVSDAKHMIFTRFLFWLLVATVASITVALAIVMLVMHLAGGIMLKSSSDWIIGGTFAGAMICIAAFRNEQLVALVNVFAAWWDDVAARIIKAAERGDGDGDPA